MRVLSQAPLRLAGVDVADVWVLRQEGRDGGGGSRSMKKKTDEEANGGGLPDSEVPDYTVVAGLKKSKIVDVVGRIAEISDEIKALQEEKSGLSDKGIQILVRAGVKSVLVDGRRVTRKDGTNVSLSRTKLFELGVSEKVLEQATTRTPYTTLLVGKVKA